MGFGGGYKAPAAPVYTPPPEPEKPEVAKPVTEAATAARQSQKDKAAKATGMRKAVLTSPLVEAGQGSTNTKLGH